MSVANPLASFYVLPSKEFVLMFPNAKTIYGFGDKT